jgi:hypothetical protein
MLLRIKHHPFLAVVRSAHFGNSCAHVQPSNLFEFNSVFQLHTDRGYEDMIHYWRVTEELFVDDQRLAFYLYSKSLLT